MKRVGVFNRGLRRMPMLGAFLQAEVVPCWWWPRGALDATAGWGRSRHTRRARQIAADRGLPFLALEDGFLRSFQPGRQCPPLSLVLDDIGIHYDFDLFERRASFDWNTTYLGEYLITAYDGAEPIRFDGHIGGGNGGYPKWRSNASFTVTDEKWTGTYSVQMIGKATDFNAAPKDIGYQAPRVFYHESPRWVLSSAG